MAEKDQSRPYILEVGQNDDVRKYDITIDDDSSLDRGKAVLQPVESGPKIVLRDEKITHVREKVDLEAKKQRLAAEIFSKLFTPLQEVIEQVKSSNFASSQIIKISFEDLRTLIQEPGMGFSFDKISSWRDEFDDEIQNEGSLKRKNFVIEVFQLVDKLVQKLFEKFDKEEDPLPPRCMFLGYEIDYLKERVNICLKQSGYLAKEFGHSGHFVEQPRGCILDIKVPDHNESYTASPHSTQKPWGRIWRNELETKKEPKKDE